MTTARSNGKHPVGRPSTFTLALATRICLRLASGQSLREIGRDPAMPAAVTVWRWLLDGKHDQFCKQYELARQIQAEQMCEEMQEIADDGKNDWMERQRPDGSIEEIVNSEHIQRSRLRVDTRKWTLSKMLPKKYGERTEVEHSGRVESDARPLVVMIHASAKEAPSIDNNGKNRLALTVHP